MTDEEDTDTDRLVSEMEALPPYNGWSFDYMFPGYFRYYHPDSERDVFFTPDWEGDETLPIQVQDDDGNCYEEYDERFPLPREGRTGQKIFEMVRPTLDKVLAAQAQRPLELRVILSEDEIKALKNAHEHVRFHMAREFPWTVRDTAMDAIGKVIAAADALGRKVSS